MAATERLLLSVEGVRVEMRPPQPLLDGACAVELYSTQIEVIGAGDRMTLPYRAIRSIDLHQPIFGANYIVGEYVSGGNVCTFTFTFSKGGATDFTRLIFRLTEGHLEQELDRATTTGSEARSAPEEAQSSSNEDKKNR